MAGERTDLGKIFITNGGVYDAETTYEKLTMISYNNSTYVTLRTVTGVTPTNDLVNYMLMAQGFTATRLESITAVDQQGLVTDPGDEMPAQTLINAIADRVANQLVSNSDLQDSLLDYVAKSAVTPSLNVTEDGKVLDAKAGKALNDALTRKVTETTVASKHASVVINELKAIYYTDLKLCFVTFQIQLTADIPHNNTLFTLPDSIPSALCMMDSSISAVNQTAIKGRVFVSGRDIKAYGTISANNYIRGSLSYPTYN